jgi:hypothetical protein
MNAGIAALLLSLSACSEDSSDDRGSGGTSSGGTSSQSGGASSGGSAGSTSTPDAGAAGGPGGGGGAGGGAAGAPGDPGVCGSDVSVTSSGIHTHELLIALADIARGSDKLLETGEGFGHTHWILFTETDFATLKEGGEVTKTTCSGNDHEFVLSCAAEAPEPGQPDPGNCSSATCGSSMTQPCE